MCRAADAHQHLRRCRSLATMADTTVAIPAKDSGIAFPATTAREGVLTWWHVATSDMRRAWMAASLGWMLDMFDVQLYALVLAALITDLGMAKSVAGLLGSATLLAAAAGGVMFGVFADRYGRTRAMMTSIIIYSIATGASGLAQTIVQLAILRVFVGIGMGGEWATGAALVAETFSTAHRQKALAYMQSFAAFGLIAAPIVTALVMPTWGWRAVFFVGVLPALLVFWIRRGVKESRMWEAVRSAPVAERGRFSDMFHGRLLPITVVVTLMHACSGFAWWGLNLWIPAYLSLSVSQGGIGLSTQMMSGLMVAQYIGQWFGYVTFGYASDRYGRRVSSMVYLVAAAVAVLAYVATSDPLFLLFLGPLVALFGTGHLSGFAAISAELYPTAIRGRAQGFTYNVGRVASAVAPFTVGTLAQSRGFAAALSLTAVAFVVSAVMWIWIPETKGRALE